MTNNEELSYREKHSRLWERYDEAAHDNAEHMRDILQLTLDALEAAEGHIFKTERDAKALLAERDADKRRIAELEARTVRVKFSAIPMDELGNRNQGKKHPYMFGAGYVCGVASCESILMQACAAAGIKLEVGE